MSDKNSKKDNLDNNKDSLNNSNDTHQDIDESKKEENKESLENYYKEENNKLKEEIDKITSSFKEQINQLDKEIKKHISINQNLQSMLLQVKKNKDQEIKNSVDITRYKYSSGYAEISGLIYMYALNSISFEEPFVSFIKYAQTILQQSLTRLDIYISIPNIGDSYNSQFMNCIETEKTEDKSKDNTISKIHKPALIYKKDNKILQILEPALVSVFKF